MNNHFIFSLTCVIVLWICMDVFQIYKYVWCKKRCSGKKCRNWACKFYNECNINHVQKYSMQILNAAGYELVIDENIKVSCPGYIPKDSFPVDFVRSESTLHFNNEEDMLVWSGLMYKHYIEFINK